MRSFPLKQPQVLSQTPGRMRVHLPGFCDEQADWLEARLREIPGVEDVQANPVTRNVLIRFDRRTTCTEAIMATLPRLLEPAPRGAMTDTGPRFSSSLLRASVRGFLGHAVADAVWFGAGFLGRRSGLPLLVWLGPLHVLVDVVIWGSVLASVTPANVQGLRP